MKKVLVTGGVGFVGTNLIEELLKQGYKVSSVDNYDTGKKERELEGCKYHNIDISKPSWWSLSESCWCEFWCDCEVEQPDIIFHLAARARIQPSFEDPQSTFRSNVLGTQNVLEYARLRNIPVIYAASSSSHGDVHANPYTFTKWQGEELIRLYNKVFNVPTVITRFYNVYGERQNTEGAYCNVLGIFERQYGEGRPLTITGDGEQRRDFTYVKDIVDGLIRCSYILESNRSHKISGEEIELGNGKNYSINELADSFGENYPTKYLDERPGEVRESLNTDTKAQDILGWNPSGDILDYIKNKLVR